MHRCSLLTRTTHAEKPILPIVSVKIKFIRLFIWLCFTMRLVGLMGGLKKVGDGEAKYWCGFFKEWSIEKYGKDVLLQGLSDKLEGEEPAMSSSDNGWLP